MKVKKRVEITLTYYSGNELTPQRTVISTIELSKDYNHTKLQEAAQRTIAEGINLLLPQK